MLKKSILHAVIGSAIFAIGAVAPDKAITVTANYIFNSTDQLASETASGVRQYAQRRDLTP
jgi:hypothetical protein